MELTISDLAARTGATESTLRMWEHRHNFPSPTRSARGHRRYREADVEVVRRVLSERSRGISLSAAIARATDSVATPELSVYASLRASRPELEPRAVRKPLLLALTRAIEDESLSRAARPILFGAFQHERAYRDQEARWRELSLGARLSIVFADFARVRAPSDGPVEVPISHRHPLNREWTLVCCAGDHAACLAAWEPPGRDQLDDQDRIFETIWSVDAGVVWRAARTCAAIARRTTSELVDPVAEMLERDPEPHPAEQMRLAASVTNRLLSNLS